MNSKGQIGVGTMIVAFIGIIVALTLLTGGISGGVGQLNNKINYENQTFTLNAKNGTGYTDFTSCVNFAGTPVVMNITDGVVLGAGNYTFTTRINPTTGLKNLAVFTPAGSAVYNGSSVNATYTCLPQGYAEDSAARSISTLVILFASLAVLVFILYFVLKSGVINI